MKFALWSISSLLVAACGQPAVSSAPTRTPQKLQAEDLVERGLALSIETLTAEGYKAPEAAEVGFLAPSMRVANAITITPRHCVAFAAAATPSIADLDAAIYASDGTVLAEDDSAGAHPLLRLCSGATPIIGYLVLHAFQGTGSYAVQRFERAVAAPDAAPDTKDPGGSQAFRELLRTLYSRGYQDETPPVEVPLVHGVSLRLALKTRAGQCYSLIADAEALRLRLLDADGRELAVGVGVEGPAALQHCAAQAADLALELSSTGRSPSALVARLSASQVDVGGARAVWLGEPAPASAEALPSAPATAKPDVCSGAPGNLAQKQPLTQGAVWERELPPSAPCTLIEVELHEGLVRATLRAESPDGAVLAQREIVEKPGSIYVCAERVAPRISLIARAGFGSISVTSKSCRY